MGTQEQRVGDLHKKLTSGFEQGEDEFGNPKVQSDRRSQFEGSRFGGATGDFAGKDFSTASYSKQRWQGTREAQVSSFQGVKRAKGYDRSPHFVRENASIAKTNKVDRSRFKTDPIARKPAAQQQQGYRTQQSNYAETRRGNTPEPLIIPYRDQQKMSVEDTKALLRR